MSWTVHIDPDANCTFFKRQGVFDDGEARIAIQYMLDHPNHRSNMNMLHDFSDVKFPSDISYDCLSDSFKRNTQQYGDKVVNCKSAIVVGDAQSYMKIHQYLVSGRLDHSSVERKAFRDIKKAFEWLGIPENYEINYPEPDETT